MGKLDLSYYRTLIPRKIESLSLAVDREWVSIERTNLSELSADPIQNFMGPWKIYGLTDQIWEREFPSIDAALTFLEKEFSM